MAAKNQKRIRIEVVPARVWDFLRCRVFAGWLVRVDGGIRGPARGKAYAIATARIAADRIIDKGGTAELYIRNRAGKIVDRRTYPRSSDPRRSKG